MGVSNITRTVDAVQSGTWNVNAIASTGFPALATDGAAAGTAGIHVLGTDGTNAQIFSTNATGHVNIADGGNSITIDDGGGSITVDGSMTITGVLAAATLADNTVNPSVGGLAAFNLVYDGSTWDLQRGNSAGGTFVQGPAAHDAVVAGSPLLMGGYASATAPVAVSADGDAVNAWYDLNGRAVIGDGGGSITVDGTVAISGSVAVTGTFGIATAGSAHITTGPQMMVSDGTNAVRLKGTTAGSAYVTGETVAALTTQSSISVTSTRTTLIASNAARKGFIIVNQGTAAIYVGNGAVVDGSTAIANGGTYISGYGGSIDGTQMCGYTGIISAVAATGTQIITVMEW